MTDPAYELFDEFAARFARGESPDVRAYLARAGESRDELAELIDAFLTRAQPPEPDDESVAVMRAFVDGRPPLLELRTRRGIRVDEIVDGLIKTLGLDAGKSAKVKRYYQQLEGGLLEPSGVDASVWDALASPLGAKVRELAAFRPRLTLGKPAFLRQATAERADFAPAAGLMKVDASEEDEVDRLFTGANRPQAPGT